MTGPKLNERPVLRHRPDGPPRAVRDAGVTTRATARYVRMSAYKVREVLDLVRGQDAERAREILQFSEREAADLVAKVLGSAIANAEHNHQVRDLDDLRVVKATADGGPSAKRVSPRAMGRAYFIKHRTSHLTVELSDETPGVARPPRARAAAKR
jgi:large subunit ribosomal protein L22